MITLKTIEVVKERLIKIYQPMAIYLFGSFAWGKPNEESDLDLLVVLDKSEEKFYKRAIKGFKSLRGLKISKDIIVYTQDELDRLSNDSSAFCFKIKNEGIKLYGAASVMAPKS